MCDLYEKQESNMKSRDLKTIHNLIVTNYSIKRVSPTKFRHSFTPLTTDTEYVYYGNIEPILQNGERCNIGYKTNEKGENEIDISSLAKLENIDKEMSFLYANYLSKQKHTENKLKNNSRVTPHIVSDKYYWGKKYAWREFGLFIPKDVFHEYMDCIGHPKVSCSTIADGYPQGQDSIAYQEEGIAEAMKKLVDSAEIVKNGPYFKSPLYKDGKNRFQIKEIQAITDKK